MLRSKSEELSSAQPSSGEPSATSSPLRNNAMKLRSQSHDPPAPPLVDGPPSRITILIRDVKPSDLGEGNSLEIYYCSLIWRLGQPSKDGIYNLQNDLSVPAIGVGEDIIIKLKNKKRETIAKGRIEARSIRKSPPAPGENSFTGVNLLSTVRNHQGEFVHSIFYIAYVSERADIIRRKSSIRRALSPRVKPTHGSTTSTGSDTVYTSAPGSPALYRFRRGLNLQKEVHGTEIKVDLQKQLEDLQKAQHQVEAKYAAAGEASSKDSTTTKTATALNMPVAAAIGASAVAMAAARTSQPAPVPPMGTKPDMLTRALAPGASTSMVRCCDAYGGCGACLMSVFLPCVQNAQTAAMLDDRECSFCDAFCLTAYGTRQVNHNHREAQYQSQRCEAALRGSYINYKPTEKPESASI